MKACLKLDVNLKLSNVAAYGSVGLTEAMPATCSKDATAQGKEVLTVVGL
jgi:hypothetical protein